MDVNQNTKVVGGTSDPPPLGPPTNPMVFDLAVMEQRLIAGFQENIKNRGKQRNCKLPRKHKNRSKQYDQTTAGKYRCTVGKQEENRGDTR